MNILLLGFFPIVVACQVAPENAVSSSAGSEKFYLRLRSENNIAVQPFLQFSRKQICSTILNSVFFTNEVHYVDEEEELFSSHWKKAFPNVYDEKPPKNEYSLHSVAVLENVTNEWTIPCFAKRIVRQGNLKLILVSQPYSFNRWIKKRESNKVPRTYGRFVFEYESSEKPAELIAVVEPPISRLDYYAQDYDHFKSLKNDIIFLGTRARRICEFTIGRKIRICSVVLNAMQYREYLTFIPHERNVEPECELMLLLFKYTNRSRSGGHDFDEWVFGCKAVKRESAEVALLYISVGYEPYQFLIYEPMVNRTEAELKYHFYSYLGISNPQYTRH